MFFINKEQEGFSLINNQYGILVIVIKNKKILEPIFNNAIHLTHRFRRLKIQLANDFILVFSSKKG